MVQPTANRFFFNIRTWNVESFYFISFPFFAGPFPGIVSSLEVKIFPQLETFFLDKQGGVTVSIGKMVSSTNNYDWKCMVFEARQQQEMNSEIERP